VEKNYENEMKSEPFHGNLFEVEISSKHISKEDAEILKELVKSVDTRRIVFNLPVVDGKCEAVEKLFLLHNKEGGDVTVKVHDTSGTVHTKIEYKKCSFYLDYTDIFNFNYDNKREKVGVIEFDYREMLVFNSNGKIHTEK
jgi:hypothetical protein